jgi:hypothetical protein
MIPHMESESTGSEPVPISGWDGVRRPG